MKSDSYSYSSSFNSDCPLHGEDLWSWRDPITKREGLLKCSVALQKSFQVCDDASFPQLACSISCVLSSGQHLSVAALRDALAIFVDGTSAEVSKRRTSELSKWLRKFKYLFAVKTSARVVFKLPEMTEFLLSFTIRGIDASHRTIAIICLAQIMSDVENQHRFDQNARSDLAIYAERNAIRHKLAAERSNICLKWRSSAGIRDFSSVNVSNIIELLKVSVAGRKLGFDPSSSHERCEDEEDSWVLCNIDKRIDERTNGSDTFCNITGTTKR